MRERRRRPLSSERQLVAKARAASAHARAVEDAEGLGSSRTSDAWEVAADAWEDAGKPETADALRQELRVLHGGYAQFKDIRRRSDAYEEARRRFDPRRYERGGGYSPEDRQQIERMAGVRHPTNEEIGQVEVFEFIARPPEKYFACYDDGLRHIQTWMSDVLGTIISKGSERRPMGGRVVSIRARAINGYTYVGTCNLSSGTY